ncbi:unnamed protein product, partial [marine sediment metagenome]
KNQKKLHNDLYSLNNKIFFVIPNNYIIGNKNTLWETLVNKYGLEKSKIIMPNTYILPKQFKEYQRNYKQNEKFMFKTKKQRQEGLFLTDSFVPLNMIEEQNIIIAQKYLDD